MNAAAFQCCLVQASFLLFMAALMQALLKFCAAVDPGMGRRAAKAAAADSSSAGCSGAAKGGGEIAQAVREHTRSTKHQAAAGRVQHGRGWMLSPAVLKERLARMRTARLLRTSQRSQASGQQEALERAWNSTQLRKGDHVQDEGRQKHGRRRRQRPHARQWDPHGVLKLAFSQNQASLLPSRRYMDARALVFAAALHKQGAKRRSTMEGTRGTTFIERCFDDTPLHMDFGHLSEQLSPLAKFVVPARFCNLVGKTMASASEFLKYGIPHGQHGVVDFFAQVVTVQHARGQGFTLVLPARVMSGKKAAHIVEALETADGSSFSIQEIKKLGNDLMLLVDVCDSASSNRKATCYIGLQTPANCLYWPMRCSVHQVFRAIVGVLERLGVMKQLFCLTNVLRIASRQETLKRAIVTVIKRHVDYQSGPAPPSEDSPTRSRSRLIVDTLLWRRNVKNEPGKVFASKSEAALLEKSTLLMSLLHGCWSRSCIAHFCVGANCRCGGSEQKFLDLLIEPMIWVILSSMPTTPSFSRWTTLGPCTAWFGLGILVHTIFKDAWLLAFGNERPNESAGDADDAGLDDFSKILGRRITKCNNLFRDTSALISCATVALLTEPLDILTANLLHNDVEGGLLQDIVSKRCSPIRAAMRGLVDAMLGPLVEALFVQFDLGPLARAEHFKQAPEQQRVTAAADGG